MSANSEGVGEAVQDVVLVTLSPANRHLILQQAARYALQRRPEAEIILKNLQQLNPQLAQQFQHKAVALEKLTLRMFCSSNVDPFQQHTTSRDVPSFLVISYCWPNPSWVPAPAAPPMTNWGLSRPMVQKILSLRQSENEGIWIDRHCIDQENVEEKIIAIGAMDVIYRAARRLVIMLEDVHLGEEEKVALKYYGMYQNMCRAVKESEPISMTEKLKMIEQLFTFDIDDLRGIKRFLLKIVRARWFTRAWCAHESKVHPHGKENNPLFLCFSQGGIVLDFEFRFVHYLANYLLNKNLVDHPSSEQLFDALNEVDAHNKSYALYLCVHTLNGLLPDNHSDNYLMDYFVRMLEFGCEVKDDLLSIALNASRIPLLWKGATKSKNFSTFESPSVPRGADDDLVLENPAATTAIISTAPDRPDIRYFTFAMLALASADLRPLLLCARPLEIHEPGKTTNRVSWVDLPHNSGTQVSLPALPNFTRYVNMATLEYIELDIFLITCIPRKASKESLLKALALIQTHSLGDIHHISGTNEDVAATSVAVGVMNKIGLDKKWLPEFLGSSIDNGLAWIHRLPAILETQSSVATWTYGTFDFTGSDHDTALTPLATELLSYFDITADSIAAKPASTESTFIFEFLRPTIRFLRAITDPRISFDVKVPRRITLSSPTSTDPSSGDYAFITSTSDRSYVAIPACLAHLPYWEKKAWIIEPGAEQFVPDWSWKLPVEEVPTRVDIKQVMPVLTTDMADRREAYSGQEGGEWSLRTKEPVLGGGVIKEDGKAVRLLKKQRIYGGRDYDWKAMRAMQDAWPENWMEYVLD